MGRYIRWQALIALSGIILAGVFLSSIALSRTTVLVPDEGGIYVEGLAGVISQGRGLDGACDSQSMSWPSRIQAGGSRLSLSCRRGEEGAHLKEEYLRLG